MTSNMAKSQKKIVEGDRSVDRLSSLPEDVIECIMNYMPVRDAARTCVLSSRWRYAWADGFCFKYLATGNIPPKLDLLNLRSFSIHDLKLDSELMAWILWILKNSPLLHTFEISFGVNDLNGGMIDNIDESRSISDFRMDQLHTVIMKGFTATPNELVLAKILLQCAPVLEKMLVEENDELDPKEHVRILKNLLSLEHASPKARVIFGPNLTKQTKNVYQCTDKNV